MSRVPTKAEIEKMTPQEVGRLLAGVPDEYRYYGTWAEALYMFLNGDMPFPAVAFKSWNEEAVARMAYEEESIEWVEGWRYGHLPENGKQSWNACEEEFEAGISLQGVFGGREAQRPTAEIMRNEGRPLVFVRGILLPWTGGDGEPLVCCAVEIPASEVQCQEAR